MNKLIIPKKVAEKDNISLTIKKPISYSKPSHTILTDDIFTYVEFYFKSHPKRLYENVDGKKKKITLSYDYYWNQARCFYNAYKCLPIESAPLPMYYCILNAAKALLLYHSNNVTDLLSDFGNHGLREAKREIPNIELCNIAVGRYKNGVFPAFSKLLDKDFDKLWCCNGKKSCQEFSLKELLRLLPFVHSTFVNTYDLRRKDELFVPVLVDKPPAFFYCSDGRKHLVAELQKSFFSETAVTIPKVTLSALPDCLEIVDGFRLISKDVFTNHNFTKTYEEYRKHFCYINGGKRMWYLRKVVVDEIDIPEMNTMSVIMAVSHRLSEIVRYKPEQMVKLLSGKESWLIHEFVNLGLDQFIDEIACEITGHEIMCTRTK